MSLTCVIFPFRDFDNKMISKHATVGNIINMVEINLPIQLKLGTSVSKRAIIKGIADPIEMVLMGINMIGQK